MLIVSVLKARTTCECNKSIHSHLFLSLFYYFFLYILFTHIQKILIARQGHRMTSLSVRPHHTVKKNPKNGVYLRKIAAFFLLLFSYYSICVAYVHGAADRAQCRVSTAVYLAIFVISSARGFELFTQLHNGHPQNVGLCSEMSVALRRSFSAYIIFSFYFIYFTRF